MLDERFDIVQFPRLENQRRQSGFLALVAGSQ